MSDLIAIKGGAFNLAVQSLKRAGKDEIAEQLEVDCECVPDLIEQLQQRNVELEKERDEEKFIAERMKDAVCIIETVNDQLAATVELAKRQLSSDDFPSKIIENVLLTLATPQQNLNALKREAFIKGANFGESMQAFDYDIGTDIVIQKEANKKYPTEGE